MMGKRKHAPMHKKLDSLKTLREGWDGFSAAPISQAVINNVKTAQDYCTDDDLKGWRALPEINGTILLQNDGLRSGIHIGNNEFSYFAIHNDTVSGDDNIAFTASLLQGCFSLHKWLTRGRHIQQRHDMQYD